MLFAAVWENKLDENILSDYLRGNIDFTELLDSFEDLPDSDMVKIKQAKSVKDLFNIVKENNIFNQRNIKNILSISYNHFHDHV